ncbi:hypothetical protein ACH5RR_025465 [Cinchona calisaya]|uniref:TF-B3 domain-containing protein n=1 Tax=Cinchona calisaya TaxID=153742 RepID=A0ABD2Z4Q5_9GENT
MAKFMEESSIFKRDGSCTRKRTITDNMGKVPGTNKRHVDKFITEYDNINADDGLLSREEILKRERLLKKPIETCYYNTSYRQEKRVEKWKERAATTVMRERSSDKEFYDDEEFDDDEEFNVVDYSIKQKEGYNNKEVKKGKKNTRKKGSDDDGRKKKKKKVYEGPNPPPELPAEVKNLIAKKAREKGGSVDGEAILVIQKALHESDIARQQNRFTIPTKKMEVSSFLFDNEEAYINSRKDGKHHNFMEVDIIEPSRRVKNVHLSKWTMNKISGKPSVSYVLNGDWKDLVPFNRLRVDDVVQLWAVRIDRELCFAFVIISRGGEDNTSISTSDEFKASTSGAAAEASIGLKEECDVFKASSSGVAAEASIDPEEECDEFKASLSGAAAEASIDPEKECDEFIASSSGRATAEASIDPEDE